MVARALTGSRIRDRRTERKVKQSTLAQTVGISPAYLNLIEHNRRRIGGKLLADIAAALDTDAQWLMEGAEAATVSALHAAAADGSVVMPANESADDLAARFPGWSALIVAQHRRIENLERVVEDLSDRMAHDPQLANSLHELLSRVTSIGSAAAILVDTDEIEAEWRDRFHRNIHEDSAELAKSSQALVAYLGDTGREAGQAAPQDELEAWLKARDFHIPELERAVPISASFLFGEAPGIVSASGQEVAGQFFDRYHRDAQKMPLAEFTRVLQDTDASPVDMAARFGVDLASVLRRMGSLPTPPGAGRIGVVQCDGSGALTFRKPVHGFDPPRFAAPCALWPLYQALTRPLTPIRAVVETADRDAMRFLAFAIAQPVGPIRFDAPQAFEATMVMMPGDRVELPGEPAQEIGMSCRICPRAGCHARREPSILPALLASQVE